MLPREDGETVQVGRHGRHGTDAEWTEVTDFVDSGPTDRHFVWDSTTGEMRFGPSIRYPDGTIRQHGAIPPEGAQVVVDRVPHRAAARSATSAPGTLTGLRSAIPYVSRVENLGPATGGVDAETVDNAKRRGPQSLRSGSRAVTVTDFERLTASRPTPRSPGCAACPRSRRVARFGC